MWNMLWSSGSKSAMKVEVGSTDPSSATECTGHINVSSRGSENHIYPIPRSTVTFRSSAESEVAVRLTWDAGTDLNLWYSLKALRNPDIREAHYTDVLCNPLQSMGLQHVRENCSSPKRKAGIVMAVHVFEQFWGPSEWTCFQHSCWCHHGLIKLTHTRAAQSKYKRKRSCKSCFCTKKM